MKTILLTLLAVAGLTACREPIARHNGEEHDHEDRDHAAETVQLKPGHGLALHPTVKANIGLTVADVGAEKIAPVFTAQLHVIQGADGGLRKIALTPGSSTEANGWLTADKAARLQAGQEVELRVDAPGAGVVEKGIVKRVEKSPYATLADFEVVVETPAPFDTGTRLIATFRAAAGDAVAAVPRSALLKTAEGWFVYVVNESFYMRTPVKVGAMSEQFAEISDGLYAGDQVVTSPVNTLWMAELQILRGGKSCTCGH